jgi:hypothetical protein
VVPQAPIPAGIRDSVRRIRDAANKRSGLPAGTTAVPNVYPPYQALLIGSEGSIWLETGVVDRAQTWHVLAPDGTDYGTLRAPAGVQLRAVSLSLLWGTERDSDGIESIVRLQLERR